MLRLSIFLKSSPTRRWGGETGNHLLSAKKTKTHRKNVIFSVKLFQQVQLVNLYIYMTCRLQKAKELLQGSFAYYACINQGVKHWLFLGKYHLKLAKVKNCKVKQGGSKTFQKRHQRNHECLNLTNLVNTRVAEMIRYQSHGESNCLLSVKSIKIEKERGACHIKLF